MSEEDLDDLEYYANILEEALRYAKDEDDKICLKQMIEDARDKIEGWNEYYAQRERAERDSLNSWYERNV